MTYLDVEVLQESADQGFFLLWVGRERGREGGRGRGRGCELNFLQNRKQTGREGGREGRRVRTCCSRATVRRRCTNRPILPTASP